MLGDVTLTVLSVKLLKPPFCDAFVTVQWWGSETTGEQFGRRTTDERSERSRDIELL